MKKSLTIVIAVFLSLASFAQNRALLSKADSLFNAGEYEQSLLEAEQHEKQLEQSPSEKTTLIDCKNLIADNLVRLGRLEKASKKAQQSTAINNSLPSQPKAIECLNTTGYIHLVKGRNDLALDKFQQALSLPIAQNDHPLTALTYNNLALVYWNTGNTDLALEYHQKALDIRMKKFGETHELVAASLNNIGLIYSSDDPDKALEYYQKALTIYRKKYGDTHPKIAIAYNNIAIIYRAENKIFDALEMFDKVLAIYQEYYGEEHPNVAFAYSSIGQMYLDVDKELALSYMNKAIKIYEKSYGNKHPEVANTYNFIGNIYTNDGQFEQALTHYQKAIIANIPDFNDTDYLHHPSAKNSYSKYTLLTSLLYKAQSFERLHFDKTLRFKDLAESLEILELCDQLIEEIRHTTINESDKIALGSISSEVYEDAVRVSSALADISLKRKEYIKKAFYFSEKNKSAVLLEAISESEAKHFANIPDDLLEKERSLNSDIAFYEQKLAQGAMAKEEEQVLKDKLFELRKVYQVFTKSLETDFPEYFNLKYNVQVASIETLQNMLNEKTAFISYFQAERTGRMYVFNITKDNFELYDIKRLDHLSRNLTGMRNGLEFNVFEIFARESHEVFEQLMPFKVGKNTEKLIIIPDGRLGTIPFEALTMSKRRKEQTQFKQLDYLIKKVAISYDYSATLYLQSKKKSDTRSDNNSILLCAPVDFSATGMSLSALPGTKTEVEKINQIFTQKGFSTATYINESAKESILKSSELIKYKFLHFATHGIVNEIKPELSEIFLNPDKSSNEDGNLFSGEIYNLQINADLVCLSACQTGLGKVSKGEGIIGLTRALLYAGSNNLIVSLWKVADESTSQLMVDFYDILLSKDDADYSYSLRVAKLKLINSKEFDSPYYWAPFILIGK